MRLRQGFALEWKEDDLARSNSITSEALTDYCRRKVIANVLSLLFLDFCLRKFHHRDSSGEVFSTRDKLSLVSEVRSLFPSCCRVPVKQDNLTAKFWSIGNFLYLDSECWLFRPSFNFLFLVISDFLWTGTRQHVFLLSSPRDISLWSALSEEQLGVWLNLVESPSRDSSGEVFSTRDELSLVTEVRIFLRVVVYRSNKMIWVQNLSIGNFLILNWFGRTSIELAVSFFLFFVISDVLWTGTRQHVFLRTFFQRDISLWSALSEEQLGVWLNLSLVTEVRIFLRVVVYRSNKMIWVQNLSIGNFLILNWFGRTSIELAVSFFLFFVISDVLWTGTRQHVFLRTFFQRDISLWSALSEEQLVGLLNL